LSTDGKYEWVAPKKAPDDAGYDLAGVTYNGQYKWEERSQTWVAIPLIN
jgi:hypothetical protein